MKISNILQYTNEFIKICDDNFVNIGVIPKELNKKVRKILDTIVMNYDLIDSFDYTEKEKKQIKALMVKCQTDTDAYNQVFQKIKISVDAEQLKAWTDLYLTTKSRKEAALALDWIRSIAGDDAATAAEARLKDKMARNAEQIDRGYIESRRNREDQQAAKADELVADVPVEVQQVVQAENLTDSFDPSTVNITLEDIMTVSPSMIHNQGLYGAIAYNFYDWNDDDLSQKYSDFSDLLKDAFKNNGVYSKYPTLSNYGKGKDKKIPAPLMNLTIKILREFDPDCEMLKVYDYVKGGGNDELSNTIKSRRSDIKELILDLKYRLNGTKEVWYYNMNWKGITGSSERDRSQILYAPTKEAISNIERCLNDMIRSEEFDFVMSKFKDVLNDKNDKVRELVGALYERSYRSAMVQYFKLGY